MKRLQPLAGIRVADFTWIGAGAYTTKLLADLGAEIVKVESAARIDSLRLAPPFLDRKPGVNRSGYFADRNTGKRSVTIDAKHPQAIPILRRLIERCDIVANNFSPGTMDRLGLGYDYVRSIRSDVIYLEMSMQGQDGPWRDHLGFGLTIGALTGLHHLTGLPGREPIGTGTNYPDHIPNPGHAVFAVLAAIRHRRRTGQGQRIDIAQTETMVALLGPEMMEWLVNQRDAQALGNRGRTLGLQGVYPCLGTGRWIAISLTSDADWASLCRVLDRSEWLEDNRWRTLADRRIDADLLESLIANATASWDADELTIALQEAGIGAGTVQNSADILERDPQLNYRNHWRRFPHSELGPIACNAAPFRFHELDCGSTRGAPLLGEHTHEICREILELGDAEIDDLVANGTLR